MKSKKVVYVGPSIVGVATRNTIYSRIPETIRTAAKEHPFLLSLCVPVGGLAGALRQIANRDGQIYTFYCKALEISRNT